MALLVIGLITYFKQWGYLWNEWLTSVDHKRIGVMYIIFALVMLLRGFMDGVMMRAHQAIAEGASQGYLPAHHYDQIFSAHNSLHHNYHPCSSSPCTEPLLCLISQEHQWYTLLPDNPC